MLVNVKKVLYFLCDVFLMQWFDSLAIGTLRHREVRFAVAFIAVMPWGLLD